MTREELRNNYEKEICELCHREYYTSRALPESLCEGQFCEEVEDYFTITAILLMCEILPRLWQDERIYLKNILTHRELC